MDCIEFIGYWSGRYTMKLGKLLFGYSVGRLGFESINSCKFIQTAARLHKINSQDPTVVTNNIFECLKYID